MFAEIQTVPESRGHVVADVGCERCPSVGEIISEPMDSLGPLFYLKRLWILRTADG
jgi:hypothetical protein